MKTLHLARKSISGTFGGVFTITLSTAIALLNVIVKKENPRQVAGVQTFHSSFEASTASPCCISGFGASLTTSPASGFLGRFRQ